MDEQMADHTTFRVGGPADIFVIPKSSDGVQEVLEAAAGHGLHVFVLGGGANILVSDRGVRGVVVDMSGLRQITFPDADHRILAVGAGLPVSDASAAAAESGLAGLDFIYSMPGSVGGAVWMNARCYGSSISDILAYADYVDEHFVLRRYEPLGTDWDYKRSPFQGRRTAILEAGFRLEPGDPAVLWSRMREIRSDRERKGHFAAPCAGSVFKNNHDFGAPSGQIIDSVDMRGRRIGGAKVSDMHANIIVNTGAATASDIKQLMDEIQRAVYDRRGLLLEPEVLLVGDWS